MTFGERGLLHSGRFAVRVSKLLFEDLEFSLISTVNFHFLIQKDYKKKFLKKPVKLLKD